jgi:hypothetical protein
MYVNKHVSAYPELQKKKSSVEKARTHPESLFLPTSCQQRVPNSKKGNTH